MPAALIRHGCVACSALAVLASSSGVSSERTAFMELVRNEISRLNSQLVRKGGVSLVFASGGVQVCLPGRQLARFGGSRSKIK